MRSGVEGFRPVDQFLHPHNIIETTSRDLCQILHLLINPSSTH